LSLRGGIKEFNRTSSWANTMALRSTNVRCRSETAENVRTSNLQKWLDLIAKRSAEYHGGHV
jgi:hypothetical protein